MTYSTTFHALAKGAVTRSEEDAATGKVYVEPGKSKNYSQHAVEAVVMSATALEAGINEAASFCEWFYQDKVPDGFVELPIRVKWYLLPLIVSGKTFDKGSKPWQDFHALVSLRDHFVHFKWGSQPPKFMRALEARDLVLPS